MPDFVRLWRDDKKIELLRLWNTAVRKCSLAIYPCFAFCLVCSQDIIVFVYGAGYREATWPFMIYLFELPVRVAVYGAVLRATGQTKPVVIGAIVGITTNVVVSIGLVYFARYVYGPQSTLMFLGPSIGTVVGIPVAVTYMLVQIMRSVDMPFSKIMPWKQLGLVMGNCLLAAIVVGCLPLGTVSVLVRLLLRAPIFAVVLLGTGLLTGMFDAGERKLLVGLLRSVGIGRNRSS
jgi:O-antigen/teichoic acid export membrane protein